MRYQDATKARRVAAPADPFSLAAIIEWLKQQPADGTYYWPSCTQCLTAKYLEAIGCSYDYGLYYQLFGSIDAYLRIGGIEPWTFGSALKRAEALAHTASLGKGES